MEELIKIAFRNIFRNSRRSLLTAFIIVMSVMMLLIGNSYLNGFGKSVIDEGIKYTGHVRFTAHDYESKENSMALTSNVADYRAVKAELQKKPSVKVVAGRISFGALLYKGDESTECFGNGIEQADEFILDFKHAIYAGRNLNYTTENEIVVGYDLVKVLNLTLGDEVTVLVRTLNNSTYALNYRIVGFFNMQNGMYNKSFYITLPAAQYLLDMEDRVTQVALFGESPKDTVKIMSDLIGDVHSDGYLVKRWEEIGLNPILAGTLNIISNIVKLVLIVLAALGIANTMMMAVYERKMEIGILKSMGLSDNKIILLFIMEGGFLGLAGAIFGLLCGGTGAYYMATHGVDFSSFIEGLPGVINNIVYGDFSADIFIQSFILGILSAVVASYLSARSIVRLGTSEALRL